MIVASKVSLHVVRSKPGSPLIRSILHECIGCFEAEEEVEEEEEVGEEETRREESGDGETEDE